METDIESMEIHIGEVKVQVHSDGELHFFNRHGDTDIEDLTLSAKDLLRVGRIADFYSKTVRADHP